VSNNKIHITKVSAILENGDAVIDLPTELIEELGWLIGDKLDYDVRDEKVYITNKTKETRECHSISNLPQQSSNSA
jgi:bifunctional DNA-binding transcriptional regulator/antitoxin component of YhaV-PrlF toxin-antitoxin module